MVPDRTEFSASSPVKKNIPTKRRQKTRRRKEPNALDFLASPLLHSRLVLSQLGYSSSRIRKLEQSCYKIGYDSGFYSSKHHKFSKLTGRATVKLEIAVKELFFQVAEFRRAFRRNKIHEIAAAAYEVGMARGALFDLYAARNRAMRGASESGKVKRALKEKYLAEIQETRKKMQGTANRPPKNEAVYEQVGKQRKERGAKIRSQSWCYQIEKELHRSK